MANQNFSTQRVLARASATYATYRDLMQRTTPLRDEVDVLRQALDAATSHARAWLEGQVAQLQREVDNLRQAEESYRQALRQVVAREPNKWLASIFAVADARAGQLYTQGRRAKTANALAWGQMNFAALQRDRQQKERELSYYQKLLFPSLADSPEMAGLRRDLNQCERKLDQLWVRIDQAQEGLNQCAAELGVTVEEVLRQLPPP